MLDTADPVELSEQQVATPAPEKRANKSVQSFAHFTTIEVAVELWSRLKFPQGLAPWGVVTAILWTLKNWINETGVALSSNASTSSKVCFISIAISLMVLLSYLYRSCMAARRISTNEDSGFTDCRKTGIDEVRVVDELSASLKKRKSKKASSR